jgi:hypothetical protein
MPAEELLVEGKLAEAEAALAGALEKDEGDDEARFALGIVQSLEGVERLMQGLYRYGLDPRWQSNLPFVRLPAPKNPKPEPLTNEAFRKLISDFAADLAGVEKTLAEVKADDVKLPVRLGVCRLDFNGDGTCSEEETLWKVFAHVSGRRLSQDDADDFAIALDKGDVHWLRGYCRLLSATCEMLLAHDTQNIHDHAAQIFFPTAEVRYPFTPQGDENWWTSILDGVAFIHLISLPVSEPERMQRAHEHLLAVIEQSRLSWKAIDAETDDDREWIPNPNQKNAVLPNAVVTVEMVDGWRAVLDEFESILQGEKLIPFWRGNDSRGVNLKRVFFEPTTFDLVLWVQGSAAAPYLEEGAVTDPAFWNRIQRGFQGQFFWFAVWVN